MCSLLMLLKKCFLTCVLPHVADYISISNRPCDLQCATISGERQLLVPAHDGTSCRDTENHGVCIEGMCQVTNQKPEKVFSTS